MSTNNADDVRDRYWAKTRNLTIVVLALWVLFALVVPAMVSTLDQFTFLGFPFGYYMIAQGSLLAFVIIIWVQNWRQDAIDDEFGFGED